MSRLVLSVPQLLAAFLAVAALATPAEARLNHSGTSCIKTSATGTAAFYNQGAIGNTHANQDMWVECPVVRQSGQDDTGTASVHTIDRKTGAGFQCSFYDVRSYGHDWSWSGWKDTLGGSVDNYGTLSWASSDSEDQHAGTHHFVCKIPPADANNGVSIIGSYATGE